MRFTHHPRVYRILLLAMMPLAAIVLAGCPISDSESGNTNGNTSSNTNSNTSTNTNSNTSTNTNSNTSTNTNSNANDNTN